MRKITKLKEIGFCYGVKKAIQIASNAVKDNNVPKPIYLLGNLVHNHHINEYFKQVGIIIVDGKSRLEMLDEIKSGTVIFTAHGVSDKVVTKAKNKGLHIIDATCPYVEATFKNMKEKVNEGYDVLFIGKNNHPETEAALSLSNNVFLANEYNKPNEKQKIIICHQTTMSSYDIEEKYNNIKIKYPQLEKLNMLCTVTERRQRSLLSLNDYNFLNPALIIIIGDKTSNNSTKLYEMAKRLNKTDVLFIDNISELSFNSLKKYNEILITSGTSTPEVITNELYELLLELDDLKQDKIKTKLVSHNYIN